VFSSCWPLPRVRAGAALIGEMTSRAAGSDSVGGVRCRHVICGAGITLREDTAEIGEHAGKDQRWWRPLRLTCWGWRYLVQAPKLVGYGADVSIRRFVFPAAKWA
jgi:hypothetical protein